MGDKKFKPVLIEWVDSKRGPEGWECLEDIKPVEPAVCYSVGFLLEDGKEFKNLASTHGSGQVLSRIAIPTCSIRRIVALK
jgi:hypothetical protein